MWLRVKAAGGCAASVGWLASRRFWTVPPPDDMDVDLNEHTVAPCLDEAARGARDLVLSAPLERVVGHGDGESQNLRWISSALHCIHDFDSLVYESEAVLAGAAAAVYVARGGPGQPVSGSAHLTPKRRWSRPSLAYRPNRSKRRHSAQIWNIG